MKPSITEQRKCPRPLVSLLRQWDRIQVDNGLFYRVVNDPIHHDLKQMILQVVLKDKLLHNCHDKPGHQGI